MLSNISKCFAGASSNWIIVGVIGAVVLVGVIGATWPQKSQPLKAQFDQFVPAPNPSKQPIIVPAAKPPVTH